MRTIAICGNNVKNIIASPSFVQSLQMNGVRVNCGLIHTQAIKFDPSHPEYQDHVLIKIKGFSCNYRDKTLILQTATAGVDNRFNAVGSDWVAEVVDFGSNVTDLQKGDRIINNNAYPDSGVKGLFEGVPTNHGSKEYRVLHRAKLMKIPPQMPDEVAAAFSIGAQTTYSMIRRLTLSQGENVLVTAAKSNTSLFAIQGLQKHNVNVYASTTSRKFEQELLDMGVKKVVLIDPNSPKLMSEETIASLKQEITGFDGIIDPFFDVHCDKLIPALNVWGRYITCGLYNQYSHLTGEEFNSIGLTPTSMVNMMINNIQIMGNCIGLTSDLEDAIADYVSGKLKVNIDSVFTGNQVAEFFERTYNAKDRFGKVVYCYD
ncbi:zinc-binding alcohol dehydrogenase family protein [Cyanobacterium aponinum FACHB-4101]|uniref:quinone oxidoreductase family protein n=1 Tax=Cyanobacterium aponinum TaxID=379064 RepID=UPI0016807DA6|nr:zinc-binding alcohol dehydrogenase family protein [Cyanobacterium aponinum]MBD2395830.1 zinc-binding alcohol dehydrogenase family protein [Cyanobacterium aponinum FACHB-4101]